MGVRGPEARTLGGLVASLSQRLNKQEDNLTAAIAHVKGLIPEIPEFLVKVFSGGEQKGEGTGINFIAGENVAIGVTDAGDTVDVLIEAEGGTDFDCEDVLDCLPPYPYVLIAAANSSATLQAAAHYLSDGGDDTDLLQTMQFERGDRIPIFAPGTYNINAYSFDEGSPNSWAIGDWTGLHGGASNIQFDLFPPVSMSPTINVHLVGEGSRPTPLVVNEQELTTGLIFYFKKGVTTSPADSLVRIFGGGLRDCAILTEAADMVEETTTDDDPKSYINIGTCTELDKASLEDVTICAADDLHPYPAPVVSENTAVLVTQRSNVVIHNLKVLAFDAPAVWIGTFTSLPTPSFGTIDNVMHILNPRLTGTLHTANFDYVIFDRYEDLGGTANSQMRVVVDCDTVWTDRAADGVTASNVCRGTSPLTQEGELYGYDDTGPFAIPPPSSSGLVLTSDLGEPGFMEWASGTPGPAGPASNMQIVWENAGGPDVAAWSNMPSTLTGYRGGNAGARRVVDLQNFTEVRLLIGRGNAASATSAKLMLRYFTSESTTLTDYLPLGASSTEVELNINATSTTLVSSWFTITAGAQIASSVLMLLGIDGNGAADPNFTYVAAEFR